MSEFHGVGGAIILWIRYRLLRFGSYEQFIQANYRLQWAWASFTVSSTLRLFGMRLNIDADPKDGRGPVLVFMQHSSIADTLLPIYLLSRPFGLSLRYVLKKELLWDPSIDIVGQRLPNVFVNRSSKQHSKQIRSLHSLASNLGPKDAAFIYPEGTRRTEKKRQRIIASLQTTGNQEQIAYAKSLEHLLPPQLGGSIAFLNAAPSTDALFCAHVGLEGSTQIKDVWKGMLIGKTIHVKFWRFDGADIPTSPPARRRWFLEKWSLMDRWLIEQHRNG
ncbi:MAG: lysophospholipid acyltransferase family protein [Myxococcales bacterium]|nr:MAG: lysophospholipid acyltransferase family protein [Myxococcales bacterium]